MIGLLIYAVFHIYTLLFLTNLTLGNGPRRADTYKRQPDRTLIKGN